MKKIDENFRDLMKNYQPDKSPSDFTVNVMNRIYAASRPISEYKPVLNKWFLRGFYAALSVFIGYVIFLGNSSSAGVDSGDSFLGKVSGYLPKFDFSMATETSNQLINTMSKIPTTFVAVFVSATLLLLLDQLVLKSRKSR